MSDDFPSRLRFIFGGEESTWPLGGEPAGEQTNDVPQEQSAGEEAAPKKNLNPKC